MKKERKKKGMKGRKMTEEGRKKNEGGQEGRKEEK